MGFMDFMFGKKEKMMHESLMSGGQQDLFNQLISGLSGQGNMGGGAFGQGMGYLQQLLNPSQEALQQFQAPYMRQFREQTIPSLAERFAGMGSGSMNSSAFGQQMGQQGAGLMEQLAALRGQQQSGAMSQLSGLMGTGLGARQFENLYRPATTGFMGAMAPALGSALGMGLTGGFGGLGGISDLLKKFMPGATQTGQGWQAAKYNGDDIYTRNF